MSQVINISDAQFEEEVIKSDRLVAIDFGATWCGPCKKLHPIMDELAVEYSETVKICYIDVGESPKVAQTYGVISVPQVLFFQNGKVVERIVGLLPKVKIKEKIDVHLKG
jgi:thioredoxin 1